MVEETQVMCVYGEESDAVAMTAVSPAFSPPARWSTCSLCLCSSHPSYLSGVCAAVALLMNHT